MKELVSYITCGFPDKEFTIDLAHTLHEAGSDRLELGLPFSDPVADGPLIEEAGHEAIKNHYTSVDAFWTASQISNDIPTYFMGYFNAFFSNGFEHFCEHTAKAHATGFIIPDLPFEEAHKYADILAAYSLSNISFLAVTHPEKRIQEIASCAKDFIYLVAFAGITGADKTEDLSDILTKARSYTDTKIFVGFGVNEQTAKKRAEGADGVIVGSAFTKILLDHSLSKTKQLEKIALTASHIKSSINE